MDLTKSLAGVEIKDAEKGTVEAVFATLNVVDKDGDVTLPGAFTDGAEVRMSAYGHGSWKGLLPVGKGTIHEVGDEAIFKGQFFLKTTAGRDTFEVVKELGELQEWSYSLHDVVAERGEFKGKQARLLKSIRVHEVSPVLEGAGIDTRTLAVKSWQKQLSSSISRLLSIAGRDRWRGEGWVWLNDYDVDAGFAVFGVEPWDGPARLVQVAFERTDTSVTLADEETEVHETSVFLPKATKQFSEHITAVLADVDALATRAAGVVALRAEKGKQIAETSREGLAKLAGQLDDAAGRLKALIEQPTPPTDDDAEALRREFARFVALTQGVPQP